MSYFQTESLIHTLIVLQIRVVHSRRVRVRVRAEHSQSLISLFHFRRELMNRVRVLKAQIFSSTFVLMILLIVSCVVCVGH